MSKPDADNDPDETIKTLSEIIEPPRLPKGTEVGMVINDPEDDYEFARQKIREAINYGKSSIESLIDVCASSGHPRAYEVLAGTIKTVVDASKTLMDNKETNVKVTKAQGNFNEGSKVINNNLFVGSPAELLKMLEKMEKEKDGQ